MHFWYITHKMIITCTSRIENKTAITDYLVDGGKIVGAIGLDISKMQPKMKLFRAKSVISTTGNTSRLYPSITGAWMFNTADCPSSAANGRAAAYRAGAALTNPHCISNEFACGLEMHDLKTPISL